MQATDMGTYIGHRRGSPLNSGRTRTWRDCHRLSVASVVLRERVGYGEGDRGGGGKGLWREDVRGFAGGASCGRRVLNHRCGWMTRAGGGAISVCIYGLEESSPEGARPGPWPDGPISWIWTILRTLLLHLGTHLWYHKAYPNVEH